jgi:hypothetical protein
MLIYLPQSQKLRSTKNAGSSRANCDFVSARERVILCFINSTAETVLFSIARDSNVTVDVVSLRAEHKIEVYENNV